MSYKLWDVVADMKENYKFVELSHVLSPETTHWSGFDAMGNETLFDYPDGFYVNKITIVSQYGTHVDAPAHFVEGKPWLDSIGAEDLIAPLCVIDITDKVAENEDYACTVEDIKAWEAKYGDIPAGSFVALRTDWSKREDLDNCDENGHKHYPAWGIDAIKYIVEERGILAMGHETSDTDPPVVQDTDGFIGETYILEMEHYQIELLKNLDQCPPVGGIIVCAFPRFKDGAGFTARCFAIVPKE